MIAIIDSGGANITSVISAFDRMDVKTHFTKDADEIRSAERVVLPGVGAAGDAMAKLREYGLVEVIRSLTQPVIGICLGMQLLFEHSAENDTQTLGVIPGKVQAFVPGEGRTVPHMGWNGVSPRGDHALVHGMEADTYFYFVHGYYAPASEHTIGVCNYGEDFTAMAAHRNFMGCQFHPERSSAAGQRILKNFLQIKA